MPATFQCAFCPKRFTRAYNLRGHLRTHTDERPFVCTVCGKAFARMHDRKVHEGLHSGEKKFVCKGDLDGGQFWGCGRRFALAKNLGRHFRSDMGRKCIKPLLDEEASKRQAASSAEDASTGSTEDVSTEPAGSIPTTDQDRHLPPPAQNRLYHEPGVSTGYPPITWMANEGEQQSSLQTLFPQSSMTAPPTRGEALRAANTLRRYFQNPDRSNREKFGFRMYLDRSFDSDSAANDFLLEYLGS